MIEFFIAFFGGIFIISKILSEISTEKERQKRYDRAYELQRTRQRRWEERVIDRALQEDLWDHVVENPEAAWFAVEDAYKDMSFQKKYTSMQEWLYDGVRDKSKAGKEWYRHHRFEEPRNILLAKHGKLPYHIATGSFGHLDAGEGHRTRLEWDRTVEFWTYIRDELLRHNIDAKLWFRNSRGCLYDIDNIEMFRYQAGSLIWLPCTWAALSQ